MFQNSRQIKEHVESVLNAEREKWAQEKARSQQALRSAEAELARLKEEASKDAVPRIPVSGHESDTEEITWPRAKVMIVLPDVGCLKRVKGLCNRTTFLFYLGVNPVLC